MKNNSLFAVTKYPDGQISVKVYSPIDKLIIRITSYEDVFILKSIADIHHHNGWILPNVFIPCLFGQQSDKRFCEKESFDLKNIAEVINSCCFKHVNIFDPHSDVSLALINNSVVVSPLSNIRAAVYDIEIKNRETLVDAGNILLVSPDAGAYKKVFKIAQVLDNQLVPANKYRDREGNISLEVSGNVKGLQCLICDDICVGGATFIQLGKKLKELGANKVFLYVSHGHFTKGFDELKQYIDHIYCTNSVKDIVKENSFLTQYKVI